MSLLARFKQSLFRWRSDGTDPLRLGQRRIFIVPSRGGLLFALALVVMLLGAINYNLALGHALVFLLAGLGITGMIHTFRNLYGLVITPGRCEPVFAGQTALFPITLDNDRNTPRLALELAAQAEFPVVTAIDGRDQTRIRVPLHAAERGWLALPRIRLWTRYPLGLFTAWAYLQPEMRCLVYPQPISSPLPASSPSHAESMPYGEGGQEDFAGFRTRQPTDSLHHVAWKASARNGGEGSLLVKKFASGTQEELIVDWQSTDPTLPEDARLGVLTGWILAAETAGNVYGLRLPDQELPPSNGDAHCLRCLEALALFRI
ncbi:MAG: DUF58 domain-containing protein [Betaproteobacteria bacterium]|nr:DUF58 domain-containing protein [Betaproteobacteria bacterium]